MSLLSTLLYYHIFRFPLTSEELRSFSGHPCHNGELAPILADLETRGLVSEYGGFWGVGDPADGERRRLAEDRARAALPKARRRSRLIAHFPFVRAVAISGTLSKGVMQPDDDVDYLVFTAPGRLWICRFLLMTFKKVFLLNSHRNFCINYLVTTDRLTIPDHNLFTATEIAWLLPTVGSEVYREFIASNRWIEAYLPNWRRDETRPTEKLPRSSLRQLAERLLDLVGGDHIDEACRRLIAAHNRHRYRHLKPDLYDVALRTDKHASKHHPRAFQTRVLDQHRRLRADFATRHDLAALAEPESGSESGSEST